MEKKEIECIVRATGDEGVRVGASNTMGLELASYLTASSGDGMERSQS